MGLLFELLTSKVGLVVMAIVALLWWHKADKAEAIRQHDLEATAKRRADIADYVVDMSQRIAAARRGTEAAQGEIRTQIVERIKEVPTYVSPLADSRCVVPRGFVFDHDAAWGLPSIPAPAGGLVDQPSGLPLSRVRAVDDENAGTCRALRTEVDAWRRWYATEAAAHDAKFAAKPQGQP